MVCAGDSITHGTVSVNYVDMLQERLGDEAGQGWLPRWFRVLLIRRTLGRSMLRPYRLVEEAFEYFITYTSLIRAVSILLMV